MSATPPSSALSVVRAAAGEPSKLLGGMCRVLQRQIWGQAILQHIEFGELLASNMQLERHLLVLNVGGPAREEFWGDGQTPFAGTVPHNQLMLVPAGLTHSLRTAGGERVILEFTPELVAAMGPQDLRPELKHVARSCDAFARFMLLALLEEARIPSPVNTLAADHAVAALLQYLFAHGMAEQPVRGVSLPSPKLRRVLDFAAAHLDKPLSLQALSQLVGMDVYRFVRAFKQTTGTSPHRYLLQLRVARAKELLRERSLSIAQIALLTGFATQSHFSVTFRRIAGMTPGSYRDSLTGPR